MPDVKTYTISVYRVQDRHRDGWTAEWDANSRYSSDAKTPGEALRNLLRFLADEDLLAHPEAPALPLQDQPINQELLEIADNAMRLLRDTGFYTANRQHPIWQRWDKFKVEGR